MDGRRPHTVTLPRACQWLLRTQSGAWLCDGQLLRNDGPYGTALSLPFVAAGGRWVWTAARAGEEFRLSLYEDSGEGPLEFRTFASLPSGPLALAAHGERALVWMARLSPPADGGEDVERLGPGMFAFEAAADGTLTQRGQVEVGTADMESVRLVMNAEGAVLAGLGWFEDGVGSRVCRVAWTGAEAPHLREPCHEVPGWLRGLEPRWLWMMEGDVLRLVDVSSATLHQEAWSVEADFPALHLPPSCAACPSAEPLLHGLSPSGPLSRLPHVKPRLEGGSLVFELFAEGGQGDGAEEGYAWTVEEDRTMVWLW